MARVNREPLPAADKDDPLGDVEPDAARRLLTAGLAAFAEQGFHATTTRDIAERAGMSGTSLYVYYRSKEELLFDLIKRGHELAHQRVIQDLADVPDPRDRIYRIVYDFTLFQAQQVGLSRVTQYEIDGLTDEHLSEIKTLRQSTSAALTEEINEGISSAVFTCFDPQLTTAAILSLGIELARWYEPDRGIVPERLARRYAELALAMLGTGPICDPSLNPGTNH